MRKTILFIISCFMLLYGAIAQTNDEKARTAYMSAMELVKNAKHTEAIAKFDETIRLLGSTNVKIQPQLIRSLVAIKDFQRARAEIDIFFGLKPNKSLADYAEITTLCDSLDAILAKEELAYRAAMAQNDDNLYAEYLSAYPFGHYVEDAKQKRDDAAFSRAAVDASRNSLTGYLAAYPAGLHAQEAKDKITAIENAAFDRASAENTSVAWELYIREYAGGSRIDDAKVQLAKSKEDAAYQAVIGKTEDKPYADYLAAYPAGRYAMEIKSLRDDAAFSRASYTGTWEGLWAYVDVYPAGRHIGDAKARIGNLETAAFASATSANTPQAWETFISKYARGAKLAEAKKNWLKRRNTRSIS